MSYLLCFIAGGIVTAVIIIALAWWYINAISNMR